MFGHRFLRNFGIIPLLLVLAQQPTPANAGMVDMNAYMHTSTEVVAEKVVETTTHKDEFFVTMEVSTVEESTEPTEATQPIEEEVVEETIEVTEATEAIEEAAVEETVEVPEATEAIEEAVVEETVEVPEATETIEEAVVEETVEVPEATEAIEEAVVEETVEVTETTEAIEDVEVTESFEETKWNGEVLKCKKGFLEFGPTGYETWYDLDMSVVVKNMKEKHGIDLEYWVDEETGLKMYGDYIMVAADTRSEANRDGIFEYGDIIEVSHGTAMVVDCCRLAITKREQSGKIHIDIATDWEHTYSIRE